MILYLIVAGLYTLGIGGWALTLINSNTTSTEGGWIALTLVITMTIGITALVAASQINDWRAKGYL